MELLYDEDVNEDLHLIFCDLQVNDLIVRHDRRMISSYLRDKEFLRGEGDHVIVAATTTAAVAATTTAAVAAATGIRLSSSSK